MKIRGTGETKVLFRVLIMAACLTFTMAASAENTSIDTKGSKSSSEIYAVYDSSEATLTFRYGDSSGTSYDTESGDLLFTTGFDTVYVDDETSGYYWRNRPWDDIAENVTIVTFDESFADANPTTLAFWFDDFYRLTAVNGTSYLNTSCVTTMSFMFDYCESLTELDLSSWNTSSVTDMSSMFSNCESLTSLDVSNWDTSSVTDMSSMFFYCFSLDDLDVSNWDTSSVTDMSSMFGCCESLTGLDVSNWDTSSVTDMSRMFMYTSLASVDVSNWNTSSVTNMSMMFMNCSLLKTLDVSGWDTSSVTDMDYMFEGCTSLTVVGNEVVLTAELSLTPLNGTEGANSNEGFENLFDSDTSTKWCVTNFEDKDSVHVVWQMSEPTRLTGFILVTGNDNNIYEGRNPAEWILLGKNSIDEDWHEIETFTGNLADDNFVEYRYDLEEPAEKYTYYELIVTETAGANVMQLSEFRPLYDGSDDYEVVLSNDSESDTGDTSSAEGNDTSSNSSGTIQERYTIDGYTYEMEVGDAITFFHSRTPTSSYYAYTWFVIEGEDLVELDPDGATCKVTAKKEGTVVFQGNLDYTVALGTSFENYSYEYTMTIIISPASGEDHDSDLMTWQTCPTCNGSGVVTIGNTEQDCPQCGGTGSILQ